MGNHPERRHMHAGYAQSFKNGFLNYVERAESSIPLTRNAYRFLREITKGKQIFERSTWICVHDV